MALPGLKPGITTPGKAQEKPDCACPVTALDLR